MRKSVVFSFLCAVLILGSSYAFAQSNQLIGDNISIFYPEKYNARAHQPSFALLSEPQGINDVPINWILKPSFYIHDGKSVATLPVNEGTSLYGTGEVTGSLLRNGKKVTLWNTDNFKYAIGDGNPLYQSHPWVLGIRKDGTAFGIIADNTWQQEIELSDSIRFISSGPAFRMIVIERKSPQEVLMELANLTGKMEMPPLWALGYQQCRFSYIPESRIQGIADTLRMKKLPSDVIWMDIDYMERFKVFTFDKNRIPDPKRVNDYLHSKGFKSVWMIDPGVKVENDYFVYESGTRDNHWVLDADGGVYNGNVWPGSCAFPDFTRPETQQWWKTLYKDYMNTGIDGVWNDMNEPSVFNGPNGSMPLDNWHRGGGTLSPDIHQRYHNVYGMLMVKASREGILDVNPDKRPFVLSRAGFLGSHRYAATWTGDNCSTVEHMKMSIPMTLNLGLSGQPFNGPDLGGFAKDATGELFGQWIAVGTFFPFMRGHAHNESNNKEPWAFGQEIEDVSRVALNRRYRLLPYFYTLFHEASKTGMPVMRPIFFSDPSDLSLRGEDQAFLLGENLLIIPRWAKNPALPKGNWRSISIAGEDIKGDKYQPDVKIKEGTIIPLGSIIQNTTEYNLENLTLVISLDNKGEATGILYEDKGDGFGYKHDEYSITRFNAKKKGSIVKISVNRIGGKLTTASKKYKIIVVQDNKQTESDWIIGTSLKVKI